MAGSGASLASTETIGNGDGSTGSATKVHWEERVRPLLTFLVGSWNNFIIIFIFVFGGNWCCSRFLILLVLLGGSDMGILLRCNGNESRLILGERIFLVVVVRLDFVFKRNIGSDQSRGVIVDRVCFGYGQRISVFKGLFIL